MSGFGKKVRRRRAVETARALRKATLGGGQYRRPLSAWVVDVEQTVREVLAESRDTSAHVADAAVESAD